MDASDRGRDPRPDERRLTPWQDRLLDRIARMLRLRPRERRDQLLRELRDGEENETELE